MLSSRRTARSAVNLLLVLVVAAACTSKEVAVEAPPASHSGSPAASASMRAPSETESHTDQRTAEKVLEDISDQVKTASLVTVYTEDDDPNKLLGRPHSYTSKIAFADSRIDQDEADDLKLRSDAIERGGSIEVFPDTEGAQVRADYIQGVQKGGAFGYEYDYVKGPILLRVTGDLTPKQAKAYEAALG